MSGVTTEIVVVLLLIVANGLFAMAEISVVSSRKARLQQRANEGSSQARQALALAEEPTRFLSTVQVGITLIGIFTGAFGGASLAEPLAASFDTIPLIAPYSDAVAFGLVVAVITYLSLVLGELVPKQLGLNNPETVAMRVAGPMGLLSRVASPIVSFLGFSTNLVVKLLGVRPSADPVVTDEEIEVLLEQGAEVGIFEEAEQNIVSRLFRLSDRRARTLMTPRHKIVWLDLNDPPEENRRKIMQAPHSRLVIAEDDLDNLRGVVYVKDLLASYLQGHDMDLTSVLREPFFVPDSTPALRLLEQFKESGIHLAMVIDEFGVIQGLITVNDLLQGIVGELPTRDEPTQEPILKREDGSWLVDGMVPIETFKEHFDVEMLPGEADGNFQTLGGFVVSRLGRIPTPTDQFDWEWLCFEVLDMDGNRVDKVLVSRNDGA